MIHQAIRNLYPNVWMIETTQNGEVCYDQNNNVIDFDKVIVAEETARLEKESIDNEYKLLRSREYPTVKEFADAMFWASQGDDSKLQEYYAACQAVKDKYPKPE